MHGLADPDLIYPLATHYARIKNCKLRPIILKTLALFAAPDCHEIVGRLAFNARHG